MEDNLLENDRKRYADDVTVQELVRLRVENEHLRKERDDYKAVLERIAPHDIQGWVHQALIRPSTKGE